jgi:hypothetical protein
MDNNLAYSINPYEEIRVDIGNDAIKAMNGNGSVLKFFSIAERIGNLESDSNDFDVSITVNEKSLGRFLVGDAAVLGGYDSDRETGDFKADEEGVSETLFVCSLVAMALAKKKETTKIFLKTLLPHFQIQFAEKVMNSFRGKYKVIFHSESNREVEFEVVSCKVYIESESILIKQIKNKKDDIKGNAIEYLDMVDCCVDLGGNTTDISFRRYFENNSGSISIKAIPILSVNDGTNRIIDVVREDLFGKGENKTTGQVKKAVMSKTAPYQVRLVNGELYSFKKIIEEEGAKLSKNIMVQLQNYLNKQKIKGALKTVYLAGGGAYVTKKYFEQLVSSSNVQIEVVENPVFANLESI